MLTSLLVGNEGRNQRDDRFIEAVRQVSLQLLAIDVAPEPPHRSGGGNEAVGTIDTNRARPLRRDCGEALHAADTSNIIAFDALTDFGQFHDAILLSRRHETKQKRLFTQHCPAKLTYP